MSPQMLEQFYNSGYTDGWNAAAQTFGYFGNESIQAIAIVGLIVAVYKLYKDRD